jgi:magnesium-dependent phosphatase-1
VVADPEMYQLWGGGAPFRYHSEDNTCTDRSGQRVRLLGAVCEVWHQIATDVAFERTQIAIASCCDEPEWAEEVLRLFRIGDAASLSAGTAPTMNELVAYKVRVVSVHALCGLIGV